MYEYVCQKRLQFINKVLQYTLSIFWYLQLKLYLDQQFCIRHVLENSQKSELRPMLCHHMQIEYIEIRTLPGI